MCLLHNTCKFCIEKAAGKNCFLYTKNRQYILTVLIKETLIK